MKNNYDFFTNVDCKYYPCKKVKELNCLFCFCPLYLFKDCGGDFVTLDNGLKDCSKCLLPHGEKGYETIIDKIKESCNKE